MLLYAVVLLYGILKLRRLLVLVIVIWEVLSGYLLTVITHPNIELVWRQMCLYIQNFLTDTPWHYWSQVLLPCLLLIKWVIFEAINQWNLMVQMLVTISAWVVLNFRGSVLIMMILHIL